MLGMMNMKLASCAQSERLKVWPRINAQRGGGIMAACSSLSGIELQLKSWLHCHHIRVVYGASRTGQAVITDPNVTLSDNCYGAGLLRA